MAQEQSVQILSVRKIWQETVDANKLDTCKPEAIVSACRQLDPETDGRLLGRLLQHLSDLATGYLTPRVNKNLPNDGRDAVSNTVDQMVDAIRNPDSADGSGYEDVFFRKLRQRLVDQIRKIRTGQRLIEEQGVDDETGEVSEPPDLSGLGPEDIAVLNSIIRALPDKNRRAFLLHRAGFPCSSDKNESIAKMMSVSGKTAETLVKDAHKMIRNHLGYGK
jgi:DNA-directed RNA polymerase specialized sigma24 family protein